MALNAENLADVAQSVRDLMLELDARIDAMPAQPTQDVLSAMMAMQAVLVGKNITLNEADSLALLAHLTQEIEAA